MRICLRSFSHFPTADQSLSLINQPASLPGLSLINHLLSPSLISQPASLPARMRTRTLRSSSEDSEDSDLMDFDNEVLETLAHLDHAPTSPTIVKISPYCLHLNLHPQHVMAPS